MGFFSNLDIEAYDRQYTDRDLVKRMFGYFRPYLGRLIGIGFLLILISMAGAAAPIVVGRGLDLLGVNLNLFTMNSNNY